MGANFPTDTWGSSLTPQRFPFVVIKAGCLRALESIQFAEAMPAPPPPAPGAVPLVHARAICLAGVVHPAAARGSAGSGSGLAGTPDSGFGFGWGSGVGPSSGTVSGPGAGPGYSAGSGGRLRTSLRFLLTHIQQPTFSFILPAYLLCKVRKARWTAVLSSYESLFCAACSRVSNCRPLQCFASPPLTIFERRNLFPWPAISEKWSRLGFLKCAGPSHRARSRRLILPFNLTSLILSSI